MNKNLEAKVEFLNAFIKVLTKLYVSKDWLALKEAFDINVPKYKINEDSLTKFYYALILWGFNKKKAAVKNMLVASLISRVTELESPYYDSDGNFYIPRKYLLQFGINSIYEKLICGFSEIEKLHDQKHMPAIADPDDLAFEFTKRTSIDFLNKEVYTDIDRFVTRYPDSDNLDRLSIAVANLNKVIAQTFIDAAPLKLSKASLNVLTFGSCFANNLSRNLRNRGVSTNTLRIEETVNTPEAVLDFLYWLYDSDLCCNKDFFNQYVSENKEQYRLILSSATHIVLTVGVGYVFEKDSKLYLSTKDKYIDMLNKGVIQQRILSVEECQNALEKVVKIIRSKNNLADIYVTLSPVPLSAIYKNGSILNSDVLSKATVRLAIEKILNISRVYYWPSFEMVKWLSPHVASTYRFDTFGEDDGQSRHPSDWIVTLLVDKFLEHISND